MNFHREEPISAEQRLNEEEALRDLLDHALVAFRKGETEKYRAKRAAEGRPYVKPLSVGRVGHPLAQAPFDRGCERAIWYEYKEYENERPFDADSYRIFGFGHAAEPIVVENLRAAGFVVQTHREIIDKVTGEPRQTQIGFALAFDPETKLPRYKGFCDGIITDGPKELDGVKLKYPMLWENKALNDKNFKAVRDDGLEKAKPEYYSQVQQYQNFLNLMENPCLFTYVNRETGEMRCTLIRYNKRHTQAIIERAARVIEAKGPLTLPRAARDYEHLPCKWCSHRMQCEKDEQQRISKTGAGHPGEPPSWLKPTGGFKS